MRRLQLGLWEAQNRELSLSKSALLRTRAAGRAPRNRSWPRCTGSCSARGAKCAASAPAVRLGNTQTGPTFCGGSPAPESSTATQPARPAASPAFRATLSPAEMSSGAGEASRCSLAGICLPVRGLPPRTWSLSSSCSAKVAASPSSSYWFSKSCAASDASEERHGATPVSAGHTCLGHFAERVQQVMLLAHRDALDGVRHKGAVVGHCGAGAAPGECLGCHRVVQRTRAPSAKRASQDG